MKTLPLATDDFQLQKRFISHMILFNCQSATTPHTSPPISPLICQNIPRWCLLSSSKACWIYRRRALMSFSLLLLVLALSDWESQINVSIIIYKIKILTLSGFFIHQGNHSVKKVKHFCADLKGLLKLVICIDLKKVNNSISFFTENTLFAIWRLFYKLEKGFYKQEWSLKKLEKNKK